MFSLDTQLLSSENDFMMSNIWFIFPHDYFTLFPPNSKTSQISPISKNMLI